jgi:uncharacterized protein (UPF0332 family)
MNQIESLLHKAVENIEVAEILIQHGYQDISVSRSYYAMFYIAEALLFSKGLAFSSHSAVIPAYGKEFAKTNLIPREHHRNLRDSFEIRQIGDYNIETSISEDKAIQTLKWADDFLTVAKEYLASVDTTP